MVSPMEAPEHGGAEQQQQSLPLAQLVSLDAVGLGGAGVREVAPFSRGAFAARVHEDFVVKPDVRGRRYPNMSATNRATLEMAYRLLCAHQAFFEYWIHTCKGLRDAGVLPQCRTAVSMCMATAGMSGLSGCGQTRCRERRWSGRRCDCSEWRQMARVSVESAWKGLACRCVFARAMWPILPVGPYIQGSIGDMHAIVSAGEALLSCLLRRTERPETPFQPWWAVASTDDAPTHAEAAARAEEEAWRTQSDQMLNLTADPQASALSFLTAYFQVRTNRAVLERVRHDMFALARGLFTQSNFVRGPQREGKQRTLSVERSDLFQLAEPPPVCMRGAARDTLTRTARQPDHVTCDPLMLHAVLGSCEVALRVLKQMRAFQLATPKSDATRRNPFVALPITKAPSLLEAQAVLRAVWIQAGWLMQTPQRAWVIGARIQAVASEVELIRSYTSLVTLQVLQEQRNDQYFGHRRLAVMMCLHTRLGACSWMSVLSADILRDHILALTRAPLDDRVSGRAARIKYT